LITCNPSVSLSTQESSWPHIPSPQGLLTGDWKGDISTSMCTWLLSRQKEFRPVEIIEVKIDRLG
jgi:hypothetical protein